MERRNTIQKTLVTEAIRDIPKHATADEIYNYIKKDHPNIGRGTIYRNLNILAEEGLIGKVEIPNNPTHFDKRCDKHCHYKCIKCGNIFDVNLDVPNLDFCIGEKDGCKILGYEVFFKGICPECLKRRGNERKDII